MGATDLSVLPQRSVVFPETVFRGLSPADVPLRVEGVVGQTANLFEVRDAAGTLKANIDVNGSIGVGAGFYSYLSANPAATTLFAQANSSTAVPVIVKGFASQTANLQQWTNSSGTILSSVRSDGSMFIGNSTSAGDTFIVTKPGFSVNVEAGTLRSYANSATATPFIAVGFSGQTANLQQWQNSAGTVLSHIQAGGAFSTTQAVYTPLISSSTGSPLTISALGRLNWNNGVFIEQNNPTDYSTAFYAGTPASRAFYLDGQATANFGSQDSRLVINFPGSGGPGERRVLVGPPDSAGAGFRYLRVIN